MKATTSCGERCGFSNGIISEDCDSLSVVEVKNNTIYLEMFVQNSGPFRIRTEQYCSWCGCPVKIRLEEGRFHQEREAREQYENILRKLVEAQDEIDIEAEKPLHQRSKVPVVKKQKAIKEARRMLGGE